MKLVLRLFTLVPVFFASYCFATVLLFSILPAEGGGFLITVLAWLIAGAASWFAWEKLSSPEFNMASSAAFGAIMFGAVGFAAGFFGPMIFAPEANQGPMLGIFITGPGGFVLGGIAGAIYRIVSLRHKSPQY